jgi:hypothetical protein
MDYDDKKVIRNFFTYYLVGTVFLFGAVISSPAKQQNCNTILEDIPAIIELFSSNSKKVSSLEEVSKDNIIYSVSMPSR